MKLQNKHPDWIFGIAGLAMFAIGMIENSDRGMIFGTIWIATSVILGRLDELAARKQIGGDKLTLTIEADASQALEEFAKIEAAAKATAEAIKQVVEEKQ